MLFSSIPFLFYFLPPVLLLYFLTPDRWKNLTLLLSSLVFYGWGEPRFLLFMLASISQGYAFGRLMERYPRHKRLFLILSAVLSLSLLGYCKYAGFFLPHLRCADGPFPTGPANCPAHRHQLLYLSGAQLRHRCLPWYGAAPAESAAAGHLCGHVPPAHCRAHRPLCRHCPGADPPPPHADGRCRSAHDASWWGLGKRS